MFGETLKAAVSLRSRIGERVGLCLEDDSLPDARPGGQAPAAGEHPQGQSSLLLCRDELRP